MWGGQEGGREGGEGRGGGQDSGEGKRGEGRGGKGGRRGAGGGKGEREGRGGRRGEARGGKSCEKRLVLSLMLWLEEQAGYGQTPKVPRGSLCLLSTSRQHSQKGVLAGNADGYARCRSLSNTSSWQPSTPPTRKMVSFLRLPLPNS